MPYTIFSSGYKGSATKKQSRNPPRQSGGTSGNLTIPGYKPRTPIKKYSPSLPRTPVQRQIRREKHYLAPLRDAILAAYTQGQDAVDLHSIGQTYGRPGVNLVHKALYARDQAHEGLTADPIAELAISSAATLGLGAAANALRGGTEAGLTAAEAAAARAGASEAGSQAAGGSVRAALQDVLKGAATKAEPQAVRAARQSVSEAIPQGVKTAAKTAARAGSYPVRHPIQAPFAFEVPAAITHGKPGDLLKPLSGTGTYANLVGKAAGAVGGVPGEAISLPATVLPTAFLTGKALVNASHGNSAELHHLISEYGKTGLLPALASGNLGEAANRLGEHPLYGGLEASGALSVLGRGLGIGARALPGDLGETKRAPIAIGDTGLIKERTYSKDLVRQLLQRAYDRTPAGQRVKPSTFRARRIQKEAATRFQANAEARRRQVNQDLGQELKQVLPRRGPELTFRGRKRGKLDRRSSEVVNLAVERIIQHPETFHEDLPHYRHLIESAAKGEDLAPEAAKRNKALVNQIKKAESITNPHRIRDAVQAANDFVDLQKPILDEMLELGLLTPEQARMARLVSFARVHMNAGFGRPAEIEKALQRVSHEMSKATSPEMQGRLLAKLNKLQNKSQLLDQHGNHLSAEAVEAEMQRRGVEPPGFLSHQPPTPGDFYQPSFGGASLPKGTRTGVAVLTGTQLGGIESLVRQLRRSAGLVHRAKTWNAAISEFGHVAHDPKTGEPLKTFSEGRKAIEHPGKYGLDPNEKWVAVPRHPFMAKKHEREGALEQQTPAMKILEEGGDATFSEDEAGAILADGLKKGIKGELDPKTPIAFMPVKIAKEFRAEATPSSPGLKGLQATSTGFKRAVLPFSPGFYIGNAFDNGLRTVLAGIRPDHFVVGHLLERRMSKETKAELLGGAFYSSVDRLAPHRSVDSVFVGEDMVSKSLRSMAEWSHKHGWKQAVAKAGPLAIAGISHLLLSANAMLTERLPQMGALGKIALADMRETQGSWARVLTHFSEAADEFAKGTPKLSTMTRLQKGLEEVYGNYSRMSPGARKILSTVVPFWTWMRAAYKFVYVTMPAHHPIQTGLLTAAQRANQKHLEAFGLEPEGEKPVEGYLTGSIPNDATGGLIPTANYNSFGFAAQPAEALQRGVFPQISGVREGLAGRNPFGEPLKSVTESDKAKAAVLGFIRATIPGINLVINEKSGKTVIEPHIPLPHEYDAEKVAQARIKRQTISVPVKGETTGSSSSTGGIDYGQVFSGSAGSSGIDYGKVFSGGG